MKRLLSFSFSLLLLFIACSSTDQFDARIKEIVNTINEQYAPDSRIAVFDINWKWENRIPVLTGEIDNPDAKEALFSALRESDIPDPVDSITVLPHKDLGDYRYALINVTVGNMRSTHRHTSELVTQVLMGTPVKVLKRHRGWYYIQSPDSYLGWINSGALHLLTKDDIRSWEDAERVVVTDYHAIVHESPNADTKPVSNVVAGSRLKQTGSSGAWYQVALPDGRAGYIERRYVRDYTAWRETRELTGENIERTALRFIGIPYLWGGTSVKGMDCSGFTKTVFWLNGKDLSRDASQQVLMGREVDAGENFNNLQTGDLLFFGREATDDSPERIVHVGIYLRDGEFIHSSEYVRINSFFSDAPNFDEFERNRFVRAKRLIH